MISQDDVNDYLEAALWSSTNEDGDPLDRQYSIDDFTEHARHQAKVELEQFDAEVERVVSVLDEETADGLDFSYLGHDFWLSRNGHGSGFFDRPERYGEIADVLQELARSAGECYIIDDPQVEDGERALQFEPSLEIPR